MNFRVNCQLRSLVKFCITLAIVERLLLSICGMSSHVIFEGFVADITFIHFLSLMEGEDVPFQSVCSGICLLAEVALKFFAIFMQF